MTWAIKETYNIDYDLLLLVDTEKCCKLVVRHVGQVAVIN